MKLLAIGDRVICRAVATMGYDERERKVFTDVVDKPFEATVTGQCRKMLGTYNSGSGGHLSPCGDFEAEPPYLAVSGSVLLWCVRKTIAGRELMITDADLEKI